MGLITKKISGNFCFTKTYKVSDIPPEERDFETDEDEEIDPVFEAEIALENAGFTILYMDINYAE